MISYKQIPSVLKILIIPLQIVNTIYTSQKEIAMLIETTMHVHKGILEMLHRRAEITGRTATFIIKQLMQRVMDDNQNMIKVHSRIRYQDRDLKENWHRLHLVLNEFEYEYFLDMRKFYKMSVSLILAYAVRRYLDEIVNSLLEGNIYTDNYIYKNYIFIMEKVNGIVCWKIYWGIPSILPRLWH